MRRELLGVFLSVKSAVSDNICSDAICDPLRAAVEAGLAAQGENAAYRMLGGDGELHFELTGSKLHKLALQQARLISALPVLPKRIAIATPPKPEFLVALLGCIYAGIECVTPPFPAPGPTRKRFVNIMRDCRPSHVLAASSDIEAVRDVLATIGETSTDVLPVLLDLETSQAGPSHWPQRQARILQYTSGTSGLPRAVCVTAGNIVANAKMVARAWDFSTEDHMLTWLPHHHDMGLFGCLITPLVVGFPVSQLAPFAFLKRPSRWMEVASKSRATITGGPAFALRMAINAPGNVQNLDLTRLRGVFCGSEPITPNLLKQFAERFLPAGLAPSAPFACYGLAEATLFVAGHPGFGPTPACGIKDDGQHDVRIVDPETRRCVADGEEGEIWVSGPSVPHSYLDAADESARTFQNKVDDTAFPARRWLRTGDLGKRSGPSLEISGRIKDMIIVNGANIPAFEIELTACDWLPMLQSAKSAVFAYGELHEGKVALLIELDKRARREIDIERAKEAIRTAVRSAHGVVLSNILFVKRGALPVTTSGKIQRVEARTVFMQGGFKSVENAVKEVFV